MSRSLLPSKGMRDFLPREKAMRERVMTIIRDEYVKNGFMEIETPIIEDIDRLVNSDGGENTKLIFKILKRGDQFKESVKQEMNKSLETIREEGFTDLGLRFDLTLPLSRYYCNNMNDLPKIFKAMQTGYVFRAERPQKGRFRGFVQCDLDVIGDPTNFAEMELIQAIANTLIRIGLKDFKVKINDRRLLLAMIAYCGYAPEEASTVCIILDKADKIGFDGVLKELTKEGFSEQQNEKLMTLIDQIQKEGLEGLRAFDISPEAIESLNQIMSVINTVSKGQYTIEFDFTLVRGMGYYTGTIFEVAYSSVGYSIAGGGRYDNMIGEFIGQNVPAVGFSIGFERIIEILKEEDQKFEVAPSIALVFSNEDDPAALMAYAQTLRTKYSSVSLFRKEKKFGKQLERFVKFGVDYFAIYSSDESSIEIKELDNESKGSN